jgi:acyl-CoA synthetase (AMP-forming)/AMP-acid ligase II
VEFLDILPTNATGKILKRELRDTHGDPFSRPVTQTGGAGTADARTIEGDR